MKKMLIMLLSCVQVNTEITKERMLVTGVSTITTIGLLSVMYKKYKTKNKPNKPIIINPSVNNEEIKEDTETNSTYNNPYVYLSISVLLLISIVIGYYVYHHNSTNLSNNTPIIDNSTTDSTTPLDQNTQLSTDDLSEDSDLHRHFFMSCLDSISSFIHSHPYLSTIVIIIILSFFLISVDTLLSILVVCGAVLYVLYYVIFHIITIIFFCKIIVLPLLHYFFSASILLYITYIFGCGVFVMCYLGMTIDSNMTTKVKMVVIFNTITSLFYFILIPFIVTPLFSYLNTFTLFVILESCFTFVLYCIIWVISAFIGCFILGKI